MTRPLSALLVALTVMGCAQPFIKDANHERVLIDWPIENRTAQAIADNCPQVDGKTTLGCARWYFDSINDVAKCRIFAPQHDSLYSREAETFLHEVTHCFFGKFHLPAIRKNNDGA